jgi:hypothetical protein
MGAHVETPAPTMFDPMFVVTVSVWPVVGSYLSIWDDSPLGFVKR